MRTRQGFGFVLAAASIGLAGAEDYKPPPMKDGLWETHSVQSVAGKVGTDMSIKMCQSKEITAQGQVTAEELRKKNQCSSSIVQKSGDTVVEESRCAKGPNPGSVTKFIYSHTGDTGAHIEMRTQRGGAESLTVMDMKYLGSCPTGMKPGDMIMPDGKKFGGN